MIPGVCGGVFPLFRLILKLSRFEDSPPGRLAVKKAGGGQRIGGHLKAFGAIVKISQPRWVADFTYVWTAEGWLYVAVMGWSTSAAMTGRHQFGAIALAALRKGEYDLRS